MKVLVSGVFLLILALAIIACAPAAPTATPQPTPTATPQPTATPAPTPTATPAPTATPLPTATPEPTPTATPAPTATLQPTATPAPTPTAVPTPTATPLPTATPEPTPTATPVVPWQRFNPRPYFSVDLPADWSVDDEDDLAFSTFDAPWYRAVMHVFSGTRTERTPKDLTVEDFADSFLGIQKKETGFELDAFYEVSPIAYRARYRYSRDGKGLLCDDLEGYGLYILQSVRMFVINLEVCADWSVQYDDAFAERVFDSLVYSNQK